jgi:hypothetical protein
LIIKYINTLKDKFLIIFGIAAGFALLNKYLVSLLFIGLIFIIPFTEYRYIFRKKAFWKGMILAFIIFLPNLIWQVLHGFPVFNHMSELYDTQLVHMDMPLFLTEQLIMPFAATLLTVPGLILLITNKKLSRFRFLGFLSLFVIVGLMILKGKSYYTLGVFPLLIASGAVAYDNLLKGISAKVILPLILVLLTVPAIPMGLPLFSKERLKNYFKVTDEKYGIDLGRRFEDGSIHSLPQDYADMLGWEEMAYLANKAYQMIGDKNAGLIYCENYGQAGAVTIIGRAYGLPEAVCFSESFNYWFPEEFSPDIKSFIYINSHLGNDVKMLFHKITEVGRISDPDAREFGTAVYLCEEPVISFNKFWKERTREFRK